jgi:hypothetical protein
MRATLSVESFVSRVLPAKRDFGLICQSSARRVWTFSAPGDQIERFRAATTLLAQFPKATSNKSYDVYLLK